MATPVTAIDDDIWKTGVDETMWQNARYLAGNDQGGGGGLKVTGVESQSAAGGSVSFASDGTIRYKPVAGWEGKAWVEYTVAGADGSSDTGRFYVQVGSGTSAPSARTGDTGSGDPTLPAVKILPVGDSNTYGVVSWLSEREAGGYRLHLDKKLTDAGLAFDMTGRQQNGPSGFDRDHEGYNGIQADGLTAKVPDMIAATRPDVILLMAGSNDTKTDSVSTMVSDMKQLLDALKAHAPDSEVLVAGLPPARDGNTANLSPSKIAAFNAELPGLVTDKKSAGMKVSFVDTSSLTVDDVSSIAADGGVHLTHAGADKLAGIWFNALTKLGVRDGTIDAGQGTPAGDAGGSGSVSDGGSDSTDGIGNPVTAVDDDMWKTGVDETLWQNARYLTWNDNGADGGLKVTAVASESTAGGSVSFTSDGTIRFTPKAGWQGKDAVQYTVADADGSTDTGKFYVQVGSGGTTVPDSGTSAPSAPPAPTTGTGNPVTAVDDDMWKTAVNETMWQNARYLTWNDNGADGGLKVTEVASKSAAGGSVSFTSDGTIRFTPKAGWQGKDAVQYTVADADGSSDTGTFYVQVGSGGSVTQPSDGGSSPTPSTGSNSPVDAYNDHWNAKADSPLYFSSRYLLANDKAPDGGLAVNSIATATTQGGKVSWDADSGTTIYRPKAGFTGRDYVEYTAVDGDGSTDTALIQFDVLLA